MSIGPLSISQFRPAYPWSLALLVALAALLAGPATAEDEPAPQPAAPEAAPPTPKPPIPKPPIPKAASNPLVIGRFPLTPDCVVDGDTVRLPKGNPSVRVLALDCEEVFKRTRDREAAAKDFAAYATAKRKDHPRPAKYGTPAGDAARAYAKALAKNATGMRLERDSLASPERGTFGRILAHVIILSPDGETNLALELVRTGHSPYFTKYGRSVRFDAAFRKAEAEAMEAQRGIWGEEGPAHYPDYPERLRWWHARADQVDRWRKVAAKPDHITLGSTDADAKLKKLVGKEATVFGLFGRELRVSTKDRRVFLMTHVRRRGFPLVFFDSKIVEALDRDALGARFATVRGKVTLYKGNPQMVIEKAAQISTP